MNRDKIKERLDALYSTQAKEQQSIKALTFSTTVRAGRIEELKRLLAELPEADGAQAAAYDGAAPETP